MPRSALVLAATPRGRFHRIRFDRLVPACGASLEGWPAQGNGDRRRRLPGRSSGRPVGRRRRGLGHFHDVGEVLADRDGHRILDVTIAAKPRALSIARSDAWSRASRSRSGCRSPGLGQDGPSLPGGRSNLGEDRESIGSGPRGSPAPGCPSCDELCHQVDEVIHGGRAHASHVRSGCRSRRWLRGASSRPRRGRRRPSAFM